MAGLELATAVRKKLRVVVVVLRDGELGMMSGIQRSLGRDLVCTELLPYDVKGVALMCGADHVLVDNAVGLEKALKDASSPSASVTVIEAKLHYDVPSLFASGVMRSAPPLFTGRLPSPPAPRSFAYSGSKKSGSFDIWNILIRGCEQNGDVVAVVDEANRISFTYREMLERASALASFLQGKGLKPGDRIGFLGRNHHQAFELHYAAAALRLVVVNMNVRLSVPEQSYILKSSQPSWLVVDNEFYDLLRFSEGGRHIKLKPFSFGLDQGSFCGRRSRQRFYGKHPYPSLPS
eukprot:TRINITY_DN19464_c0_g1_i3.p1 TRINITY_DN19464_c0_g1~~TRINITY_DN19464_c0_g1_i3.p1  ORF type:complete len:292 (+),score=52.15 TRINITY_DN19464_c0_g1_i3:303-1178(+)